MTRPVVSVAWLHQRILEPDLRVVDVRWYLTEPNRGRADYTAAHIPGAVFLDLEDDLSDREGPGRHPLPDPATFAARLGEAGIGTGHHVVIYDDSSGGVAARLWWMLRHLGHDQMSVLDGGFRAWLGAEYPVTTHVPALRPTTYEFSVRSDEVMERHELRDLLGRVLLIDARTRDRYEGIEEPIDPVAGHIPTAVNAPYADNVTELDTLLPPDVLRHRYEELGVLDADEVVVYCGSGVTACHHLLAMEVAGIRGAKLYPGSWSDWSTAGYPTATGPEPGSVPL
jgi:thiosulfate/3-mercaptopyruvate sulfurtransferase